jgi:hypothetical protein
MSESRDYILEIGRKAEESAAEGAGPVGRPFLSVRFACCNTYTRIYRNAEATAYRGRCPRCGKAVSFAVGNGGTDARFFVVY